LEARSRRPRHRNGNRLPRRADGEAKLTVAFESHHVDVPVSVKQSTLDPPISFKLGRDARVYAGRLQRGSCHGSARGKDGFRLLALRIRPDGDYYA